MYSRNSWNHTVDQDFRELAGDDPPLFRDGYPEHQWEGKYRLQQGDVYVEAGAFWGRYGLVASNRVGPDGKVLLIEADPSNCEMIERITAHYRLDNVTLVKGAVFSTDRIIKFYRYGNPAGSRVACNEDEDYPDRLIEVPGYTLDTLLNQKGIETVDLLASDIEGAELAMLKGAEKSLDHKRIKNLAIGAYHKHTITENKGEIKIERTYKRNAEMVQNLLRDRGYRDITYLIPSLCPPKLTPYQGIVYAHV